MTVQLPKGLKLGPFALAVAVTLLFVAVVATYESRTFDWPPYIEEPPDFSTYGIVRSLLILALSAFVIHSLRRTGAERPHQDGARQAIGWVPAAAALFALSVTAVFVSSPNAFNRLALEDGPIEWASAAALFLSCGLFLCLTGRGWRDRAAYRLPWLCLSAIFAFGSFFIGMEEVSWMQRPLGFETPAFLARNFQNEANLHNLSTDIAENIYYLCAFVFLIGLPYLCETWKLVPAHHWLAAFVPARRTALTAAPLVGFNYDMWNVIPIQMAFYLTVLILADYLYDAWRRDRQSLATLALVLAAVVLPKVVFLTQGASLLRPWDPTEYKELFIPMALLVYAFQVLAASRRAPASA